MITENELSVLYCRAQNEVVGCYDAIDGLWSLYEKYKDQFDAMENERGETFEDCMIDLERGLHERHENIEKLYDAVVSLTKVPSRLSDVKSAAELVLKAIEEAEK